MITCCRISRMGPKVETSTTPLEMIDPFSPGLEVIAGRNLTVTSDMFGLNSFPF